MRASRDDRFASLRGLMRRRVEDILLLASPYDRFVLEEDGAFSDRLLGQYLELNLTSAPRVHQVSTWKEGRAALDKRRYDLVIITPHCADRWPLQLPGAIDEAAPGTPVAMLTYDRVSAMIYADLGLKSGIEEVYLWSGDPSLLLALVKSVEDRLNVADDTTAGHVRVILLVEDNPVFYSSYLPILYKEVVRQTQECMGEALSDEDRLYRMRARPKILMARTCEGALALGERYREYLLGVVLDMGFPRRGRIDPQAGKVLVEALRARSPELPILLQSADTANAATAERLAVAFADKNSPHLLDSMRRFISDYLGFGPFIFRLPDGREVDRARDIQDMARVIERIPGESLRYHYDRNHFSAWLTTRCEFRMAETLRPLKISDFESIEAARVHLAASLRHFLEERQRGKVTVYIRGAQLTSIDFTRLDTGSMGGKARGIAFLSQILAGHPIHAAHPEVRIFIPRTKVICTDAFSRFVERDDLRHRALAATSDEEVARLFLSRPLDAELTADLRAILRDIRYPLAVRSSSLQEDSAHQALAGLYRTLIVPNQSADPAVRLDQLSRAIRMVWASTLFMGPRAAMASGAVRLEEEKMAVIVQRLVGSRRADRFYPDFAGVAQSVNFYPIGPASTEEGVVTVALGLGQTVVEGGKALRFSPRHPDVLPQMSSVASALETTQTRFVALDLSDPDLPVDGSSAGAIRFYDLSVAESDGSLEAIGATYDPDDDRIRDSLHCRGARLVNFAGVLKYGRFPLAAILADALVLGVEGMGSAVEIEFAAALEGSRGRPELALLQLRPLSSEPVESGVDPIETRAGERVVLSGPALGNGTIEGIRDVVYVHPRRFRSTETPRLAVAVATINARLSAQGRPYLLAAPGRWGTADPHLGIPVVWAQVSCARVIVELGAPGFRIDPSQGTHFFHNITSRRVGYFSVDLTRPPDRFDLDWLESLATGDELDGVRHVALDDPLEVRIDGREHRGTGVVAARAPDTPPILLPHE